MPTFQVGATTSTFLISDESFNEQTGQLPTLRLSVVLDTLADWVTLNTLVTEGYAVRLTLSGDKIIQTWAGPGVGTLTPGTAIAASAVSALLIGLTRSRWLSAKVPGEAVFLITTGAVPL